MARDNYSQGFTKVRLNGILIDNLGSGDPIRYIEPEDGATVQAGLSSSQLSYSTNATGMIEIDVWGNSNARALCKALKAAQITGNALPLVVTLQSGYGEIYTALESGVQSTGGLTTGGAEGAVHTIKIACKEIVALPQK